MNFWRWLKSKSIRISAIKIRLIILATIITFAIAIVFLAKPSSQIFGAPLLNSESDSDTAIIKLSDRQAAYDLSNHLKFLEDKDSNLAIEQVSSVEFSNQFKHSDRQPPNFGYTDSTYWGKVQLKNPSDQNMEMILSIDHPHIDRISLYFYNGKYNGDSPKSWTIKSTGLLYPFSSRDIPDRLPAFGCWEWDICQNSLVWDDWMYEIYGIAKQSDTVNYDIWVNSVHPDDRNYCEAKLQQAFLGNSEYDIEFRIIHPDRSLHFIKSYGTVIRDDLGNPQSMVGVNFDISDRKSAELQLQQSEATNRAILNAIPDLLLRIGRDGSCHSFIPPINDQFRTFIPIENNLSEVLPPDLLKYQLQRIDAALATGELQVWEHQVLKHGKPSYEEVRLVPCGTDECLVIVRDISDRKRIEQDLQLSEARLKAFLNNSPAIIFMKDLEGRYLLVNQEFERVLRTSQAEVLGKTDFDFMPPEVAETLRNNDRRTISEGIAINFEETITMSDGIHTYFANKFPILDMEGNPYATGGISIDISDRKQVEIELAKAKDAAELATMAKSEFLANMSHEIRTPMNGVLGIARLLSDTNLNGEQQNFVQIIQQSGDALLAIINDILDFSKIESGMLRLEAGEVVIEDILSSICKLLNSQAIEKQIHLDYAISGDIPIALIGDSSRLRQILLNLIGNALKFTPSGSVAIAVSSKSLVDRSQHELTFMIKDTGIGIGLERLDMLFRAFSQADTSISRKYGGTGLGLAISKRLVELMGGTIWVESFGNVGGNPTLNWFPTSPTQGSTFYFTIVLSAGAIASHSQKQSVQNAIDPQMAEKYPLRILLAEDNPVNQKVAIFSLKKLGYQVDVANNGLEALNAVRQQTYDLVLMDVQMLEMDGLTATRLIRQSPENQPRIVAMTANALPEDRQTCLDAGMDDYLSKPFNIKELIRVFSNCDRP